MRLRLVPMVALLAPLALAAQETIPTRVRGTVRDSAGKPIENATLLLKPGGRVARTAADGSFGFDSLTPGMYDFNIRRLGFNPIEGRVRVQRDTTFDFRLLPRPNMLDTVVVVGECSGVRFSGFLCRRTRGQGIFLSEEDILAKNPTYIADALGGIPGVKVYPVMTPYGQMRRAAPDGDYCITELVDGRVSAAYRRPPGAARLRGSDRLSERTTARMGQMTGASFHDFFGPDDLIGVEVYPPGTPIPEEYRMRVSWPQNVSTRCMLVNYWTTLALPKRKAAR